MKINRYPVVVANGLSDGKYLLKLLRSSLAQDGAMFMGPWVTINIKIKLVQNDFINKHERLALRVYYTHKEINNVHS